MQSLGRVARLSSYCSFGTSTFSGQLRGILGLSLPQYPAGKEVPVYNIDCEQVGLTRLPEDIFGVEVRRDILQRVVRWQQAKKQQGTHSVKGRSEVRGGGRKPWSQKGSGRARAGSIRSPQFRGGGIVHGPVPRLHAFSLPKQVRRLGLKCALSARATENRLLVLDTFATAPVKTKALDAQLQRFFGANERLSALLVDSGKASADGGETLRRAAANLHWVDIVPQEGLNVYSILRRSHVLVTKDALEALLTRMRTPIFRGPLDRARWQALLEGKRWPAELNAAV